VDDHRNATVPQTRHGGLGLGTIGSSALFLVVIAGLLALLTREQRTAAPAMPMTS